MFFSKDIKFKGNAQFLIKVVGRLYGIVSIL